MAPSEVLQEGVWGRAEGGAPWGAEMRRPGPPDLKHCWPRAGRPKTILSNGDELLPHCCLALDLLGFLRNSLRASNCTPPHRPLPCSPGPPWAGAL